MGMYTEIYINVDLKEETPNEVIDVILAMCNKGDEKNLIGRPERWDRLFNDGSCYTPMTSCAYFNYNESLKQWSLLGKGDIKNYQGEIEQFFDWLMPYIDANVGDFIGYKRYEEYQEPTLIYKQ